MKKSLPSLLLALAVAASPAAARQLSPEQALAVASSASTSAPGAVKRLAAARPVLDKTLSHNGLNTIYIFNRPNDGGFLILSADDAALAVLGFSDSGRFDVNDMPVNVTAWLDFYSAQIADAAAAGVTAGQDALTLSAVAKKDIAPMVKTMWNQDSPFNDQCPMIGNERTVTGCVATALAQVMNYHQWPEKGTGTISYTWRRQNTKLSMNVGAITFDWDQMLDNYNGSATTLQRQAVATLMQAAGYASQMNYGLASTGGSGASYIYSAQGLINNLGYDKGLSFRQRDYYSLSEWTDLVYNEIAQGRPVLYSGSSATGAGHAFVFDGYRSGDFFHVNWGWGGMSNGYFRLTALSPDSQGIGGSGSGYNIGQDILVGVQRPVEGSKPAVVIYCDGDFDTDASGYTFNDTYITIKPSGTNGGMWNYSPTAVTGLPGIKLVAQDGTVSYIASSGKASTLTPLQGWTSYRIASSQLPEGTFIVSPAVKVDNQWIDVRTKINMVGALKMTNNGVRMTFEEITNSASLAATDITVSSPIYNGYPCKITAKITNSGNAEFLDNILALLVDDNNNIYATSEPVMTDITPGESIDFESVTVFNSASAIPAGSYRVALVTIQSTSAGIQVKDILGWAPAKVTVATTPASTSVSVKSVMANDRALSTYVTATVPEDVTFSYTLTCTKGFISGLVGVSIFYNETTLTKDAGHTFVSLTEGKSAPVEMNVNLSELEENHTYLLVPWDFSALNSSGQLGNPYKFKVDKTSGVTNIVTDGTIVATEIYDAAGVLVATDTATPLPAGVYIVRTTMDNGLVITTKMKR